jgi:hypothetical protein
MGLSCRRFLIARDDTLGRLANTTFDRMLRDPLNHCLPDFARQRVRMADVTVELVDRKPVRVVRRTFAILTFDDAGGIDTARFGRHQLALAASALDPVFAAHNRNDTIVDAAHRFIAQGGSWTPSRRLARAIDDAAFGRLPCRALIGVPGKSRKAKEP